MCNWSWNNSDSLQWSYTKKHVEPWIRWATAAEDHTGCHASWIRTGNWGCSGLKITKKKIGQVLPNLMSHKNICYNIWMVRSEFGIDNMKVWVLPALFRMLYCCDNGMENIFLVNTGIAVGHKRLFKCCSLSE